MTGVPRGMYMGVYTWWGTYTGAHAGLRTVSCRFPVTCRNPAVDYRMHSWGVPHGELAVLFRTQKTSLYRAFPVLFTFQNSNQVEVTYMDRLFSKLKMGTLMYP